MTVSRAATVKTFVLVALAALMSLVAWRWLRARTPRTSGQIASERFDLQYDPSVLTDAEAARASTEAEAAFSQCLQVFGVTPRLPIRVNLTPKFKGVSGRVSGTTVEVRYGEMDFLGPPTDQVLTHEIAHLFARAAGMAGGMLDEGVADWATGRAFGVPISQWWAKSLRQAKMWSDPGDLFISRRITFDWRGSTAVRSAFYTESALLVKFLVDTYGRERTAPFLREFASARGESAIRESFVHQLAQTWENVREGWERAIQADPEPPDGAQRLVLGIESYALARDSELRALKAHPGMTSDQQARLRQLVKKLHEARARGDFLLARQMLTEARSLSQTLAAQLSALTPDGGK